jgi:ribosomal protein S18 acetylase RimI-like enzyme
MSINYVQLSAHHFDAVIALGNQVHGDNYLDQSSLSDLYQRSWSNNINASWVAVLSLDELRKLNVSSLRNTPDGYLIGFRLTIASNQWTPDKWCLPLLWDVPKEHVCYFKCNTVDAELRGRGVGSRLLKKSIDTSRQQGALAGVAHIWLASPGNSALSYFKACGGQLVKEHTNRWQQYSIEDGYDCPVCGAICQCTAAEMILRFNRLAH